MLTPFEYPQLNLKANYILTHHFLPKRSRKASIVASVPHSIHLSSPTHIYGQSAYLSSKITLIKLLEVVAAENPDLFVASYHPGNGQSFQTFSLRSSQLALSSFTMFQPVVSSLVSFLISYVFQVLHPFPFSSPEKLKLTNNQTSPPPPQTPHK